MTNLTPENVLVLLFGALLLIWSLIWKALALYKSAHKGDVKWFVVLFLVQTLGILDIIYFYYLSKEKEISYEKDQI